jgi:CheY-like chemotaxis protein
MPLPEELGTGILRLLVVDDEKLVVEGIKRAFRAFGSQVEVTATTSGVEALLLVAEQKPHGLLVDLNMPGLDGFEVCRKIGARRNLEGTKVIAMTGRPTPEVIDQALKAGAVACLPKPVDAQQIMDLFRAPAAAANKR